MSGNIDIQTRDDRPAERQARRFSEGLEQMPLAPSVGRVGSFADEFERSGGNRAMMRRADSPQGTAQSRIAA